MDGVLGGGAAGGGMLAEWLGAVWFVLTSSGPYLLLGFVIAGLLKVLVPERWIVSQVGRDDTRSVAVASLLGLPLPMCSCSVIPAATQLRRAGASKGATTSFLISAPEVGVESVGVTWALMDPLMTVVRPLSAFFTAFVSGTLVNSLVRRGEDGAREEHAHEQGQDHEHGHGHAQLHAHVHDPALGPDHGDACTLDHDHSGADTEDTSVPPLRRALRYAFGPLLDDLAPWLLLGFLLAGLIVVAVPDSLFTEGALLSGPLALVVMLFVGLPLYLCASAATPVAAALMAKGLDPGAALVLLLAGPASNIATILIVRQLLGRRTVVVYLASIAACSLALGALVNALYPFLGLDPTAMRVGDPTPRYGVVSLAAGALVAVLVLRAAVKQRVDRRFFAAVARGLARCGVPVAPGAVRAVALTALVLLYGATGISVVRPGETGFLVRFGGVIDTLVGPDYRWHAPWPLTRLERVPIGELRQLSYGLRTSDRADGGEGELAALDLVRAREEHERRAAEAEVLTRDEYLLAVGYTVRYRVVDATRWRYGFEEPDRIVGALAEGALRSAAARLPWRDVLGDVGGDLARAVEERLAARLAAIDLGVEVVAVDVQSAHAPDRVHGAFRDVASASEDRAAMLNRARQATAIKLATAHGDALERVRSAEAAALRETTRARGEAGALAALGEVYERHPAATRETLEYDLLERALSGRTLLLVLSRVVFETYDKSGGTLTPPPDIFSRPLTGSGTGLAGPPR